MVTRSPGSVFSAGLVLQGRYRLDEPLARGGMAEVWRGHDLVLQRQVAIKLLHPHLASDAAVAERFRREAISAARLSHPHIVPTYDAGTDAGVAYIVLGLVHGPSLAEVIKSGRLPQADAVHIARQVADALQHAHHAGLVHRDVKPANVLVVDRDQRVMVADFGIAKAVAESADESLTLPGLVIGTPAYVAPEQAQGADTDGRADIYALGVLLHEMVCGHTSADVPTQLGMDDPGTSSKAWNCGTLPGRLDGIIQRATEPDPEQRFQTAQELHDALLSYEKEIDPRSTPPSGTARTGSPGPSSPSPGTDPSTTQWTASSGPSNFTTTHADPTTVRPSTSAPADDRRPERERAAPESPNDRRDAPFGPASTHEELAGDHSSKGPGRKRAAVIVVVIVLVLASAAAGRLIAALVDDPGGSPTPTTSASPLNLTSAQSFDPFGSDGTENQAQVTAAIDGNPATSWSTETYNTRRFGNLKQGVGLVLKVDASTALRTLTVDSPSSNWSASVFVNEGAPAKLADWGQAVDTKTASGGSTTFDLHGQRGKSVLLWIIDLGDSNRVTISEAHLAR